MLFIGCNEPISTPTPRLIATEPTPVELKEEEEFGELLSSSGLSIADVVERVIPSVVQVITEDSTGSGFIISSDGFIITNRHVVEDSGRVLVELNSGDVLDAAIVLLHPVLDLAYLKIEGTHTPVEVRDSDDVRIGEEVIIVGYPYFGSGSPTVSTGILSAHRDNRLQTDAALNPGNSGGPMFDIDGNAIGVVVSRVERDATGRVISGIGFAIPINYVDTSPDLQVLPEPPSLPVNPANTPTPTPRRVVPLPIPTSTIDLRALCTAWQNEVLDWIEQGNEFRIGAGGDIDPNAPAAPSWMCGEQFPVGVMGMLHWREVGYGEDQLLPGLYQYKRWMNEAVLEEEETIVDAGCQLNINLLNEPAENYVNSEAEEHVILPVGEEFTVQFTEDDGFVYLSIGLKEEVIWHVQPGVIRPDHPGVFETVYVRQLCQGGLYRIGDS